MLNLSVFVYGCLIDLCVHIISCRPPTVSNGMDWSMCMRVRTWDNFVFSNHGCLPAIKWTEEKGNGGDGPKYQESTALRWARSNFIHRTIRPSTGGEDVPNEGMSCGLFLDFVPVWVWIHLKKGESMEKHWFVSLTFSIIWAEKGGNVWGMNATHKRNRPQQGKKWGRNRMQGDDWMELLSGRWDR